MNTKSNIATRKRTMAAFLAVASMLGFLLVTLLLFFCNVNQANLDLLKMCLIALLNCVTTSYGYFLGSSDGSARKDEERAAQTLEGSEAKTGDA